MAQREVARVLAEVKKAVVGKDGVLAQMMLAVLCRGHVLLEDIPGVGKTTMALAFSKALGLSYHRVQFTPDVMPSDLTGFTLYRKETGTMEYQPGALMCSLFLADELNRAQPDPVRSAGGHGGGPGDGRWRQPRRAPALHRHRHPECLKSIRFH